MSYILDALRKSEAQRQTGRDASGGVSWSAESSPPSSGRIWIWLLAAVGLLLAVALLWNLLSISTQQLSAVHSEPAAEKEQDMTFRPLSLPPKPVAVSLLPPESTTESHILSEDGEANTSQQQESHTVAAAEQRALPPLDALRRIPQLMINSHIYSPLPDKRSVIMNNREWHEGDYITEGVTLKEITADGILLNVEGWPVHVGRSKGWQAIPGSDQ